MMLTDRRYLDAKKLGKDRPLHFHSDQQVLEALLGSAEFADVPVQYLKNGPHVIQDVGAFGYPWDQRIRHVLHGLPLAVHAMTWKPWNVSKQASLWERLKNDLSVYPMLARRYRDRLDEPAEWLEPTTVAGRVLRGLSFGHPSLPGLVPSLARACARRPAKPRPPSLQGSRAT